MVHCMGKSKAPERIEVLCAFCRGRGKDPFGIPSPQSRCQVCGGRGHHTLRQPIAACAYCKGTGVHPFSRLTCTTCRGIGVNEVPRDATTCPRCGGSGREADYEYPDSVLSCRYCLGKGVVSMRGIRNERRGRWAGRR